MLRVFLLWATPCATLTDLLLHDTVELERALVVKRALRDVLAHERREVHIAVGELARHFVRRLIQCARGGGELLQQGVWAVALQ